jgi:hypothetical protein
VLGSDPPLQVAREVDLALPARAFAVPRDRRPQTGIVVAGHGSHPLQAPHHQPPEQLLVCCPALGVGDFHHQDLASPIVTYPGDEEHPLAHDRAIHSHVLVARIDVK